MSYFTEMDLRYAAINESLAKTASVNIVANRNLAQVTAFLCHSHKDKDVVQGFIRRLAALGIKLYVDWNDTGMSRITNRETAEKIKGKIKEMNLFMMLATSNAIASRWCPWELGVADQMKGYGRIIIVPVTDSSGVFWGSEYLQLYKRISPDGVKIGVFEPGSQVSVSAESFMGTIR